MDRLIKISAIGLILAHVLTEVHGFIWDFYPKYNDITIDPFWSKTFHMKLSLHWYVKFLCDDFFTILVFFIMAKIALEYSVKLYLICMTYFLYHIADAICFMYNYKQDRTIYMALLYSSIIAILVLIVPEREKMHLVK